MVQDILGKILTPNMSTFDKVCAIYGYLMKDGVYHRPNGVTEELYKTLGKTISYSSPMDAAAVCEAYGLLVTKIGDCLNYASACMVMSRAIGIEAYVISCGDSTAYSGSGNHHAALFHLIDGYYIFDPVIGVVRAVPDVVAGSEFFCKPFACDNSREFCNLQEMLADYCGFRQGTRPSGKTDETFPAAVEKEQHFVFGSYPQTQVKDNALIKRLNAALKPGALRSCGYSYGAGEPGTQTVSDYMKMADITLDGTRYRAVTFSAYRPIYCYYPQTKSYSYQDDNGYEPNVVYWFRFEPVEWRVLNEGNLLLCDMVLDAQPFNFSLYPVENGKTINGKTYYLFTDQACTIPANSWSTSTVRSWLNSVFYNTAFTEEEKALIAASHLKNYGYNNRFSAEDSTDRVFLLSYNDMTSSGYALAQSNDTRANVHATDYAGIQGISFKRKDKSYVVPWLLRSPGYHSEDVCMVAPAGEVYYHYNPGVTHNGIRPAIQLTDLSQLISNVLPAPQHVKTTATATGELTVKSAVVNGAEGYIFQRFRAGADTPEETITSDSPTLIDRNLSPGVSYSYRVAAFRTIEGRREITDESQIVSAQCRSFVSVPNGVEASSAGTGAISLQWPPVEGAGKYRIYRYKDADTVVYCAETKDASCTIEDLGVDVAYYFCVSAVSEDGWESAISMYPAICVSRSFPERPKNVTATPTATGKIRVQWSKVQDAARYQIFRYISATETVLVKETAKTEYTVSDLNTGFEYVFFIKAVTADGKNVSSRSLSARTVCESFPPVPANVNAAAVSTGSMRLTWTGSEKAARYKIYRYTSATETLFVGETAKTEYTVSELYPGAEYLFFVTAESADGKDVSSRSAPVRAVCESIPPAPADLTVTPVATGSLRLTWTGSEKAARYKIYRYTSATQTVLMGATEKTEYTVSDLNPGFEYVFFVTAETADGKNVSSKSLSARAVCESIPPAPTDLTASAVATGSISLSWTGSEKAARYKIYRYTSATETVLVGETAKTEYTVTDLYPGAQYLFFVTAETEDGKSVSGKSTIARAVCESIPPAPVELNAAAIATGSILLTWTGSKNAAQYKIYRYTSDTETVLVGETANTDYTVTNLYPGSEYVFYITAETAGGKSVSLRSASLRAQCQNVSETPKDVASCTSKDGAITLNWTGSPDAAVYKIYQYTTESETKLVGETEKKEFSVPDLNAGSEYVFRIDAVRADGARLGTPVIVQGTAEGQPSDPRPVPQTRRPGDVDNDGKVTSADARLALRRSVRLESFEEGSAEYLACDVDGTPGVSSSDARLILRAAVGLEDLSKNAV
ncbi:MAG: fibronectin type III domain-containing protein [Clostridia bacterium]|nr:fibronectin type III domain-containing protein [Clostridia bacterium]